MEFQIDFNRETDDKTLELLGAKLKPIEYAGDMPPFEEYFIEVENLEALEELLKQLRKIKGADFSMIINFKPNYICFDMFYENV